MIANALSRFTGTTNPTPSLREIEHRRIACRAAEECIVLLRNKHNLLPLNIKQEVALYGSGASQTVKGGTGSADMNERDNVSIYQGMKNAGFSITSEKWIEAYDNQYQTARNDWRDTILKKVAETPGHAFFPTYSKTTFQRPVGASITNTTADIAIYVLGRNSGEATDRKCEEGDYFLTKEEKEMVTSIASLYKHFILVINTASIVDLNFIDEFPNIDAILQISQLGMEGGTAFANIILGNTTPSGKLSDTWAYHYADYPNSATYSHNNGNLDEEFYTEGIYVGYRYFDTFNIPARFGFGYGMSYTDFTLATQNIDVNLVNGIFTISVLVKNTGDTYAGKEVLQVYLSCPTGNLDKEYRRLVGFVKTRTLQPNEEQIVTVQFTSSQLASFSEKNASYILEKGYYGVWIGNSLESSQLEGAFVLDQTIQGQQRKHLCPLKHELHELKPVTTESDSRYQENISFLLDTNKNCISINGITLSDDFIGQAQANTNQKKQLILKHQEHAAVLVDTLSTEQLIHLVTGDPEKGQGGNIGASGILVPGSAGETSNCANENGIDTIVMADGPVGLRLMQFYDVNNGMIENRPFEFGLEKGIFCPGISPGEERYYQYCTAIPVGTALAQTWNADLLYELGDMVAKEMIEFRVTLWLAPALNIHRNPLCGRNFEYFSEDPLLSGVLSAAITNGVQQHDGCGMTIKHYSCYSQEENRKYSNSIISERAIREIYIKGFEITVKTSQPWSIMTSYNMINGVYAASNYDLCTIATREEWNFWGMFMTDWSTTNNNPNSTASGCMRAGNDLVMPGFTSDHDDMRNALANGTLTVDEIRQCAIRIVTMILQGTDL